MNRSLWCDTGKKNSSKRYVFLYLIVFLLFCFYVRIASIPFQNKYKSNERWWPPVLLDSLCTNVVIICRHFGFLTSIFWFLVLRIGENWSKFVVSNVKILIFGFPHQHFSVLMWKNSKTFGFKDQIGQNLSKFLVSNVKILIFGFSHQNFSVFMWKNSKTFGFKDQIGRNLSKFLVSKVKIWILVVVIKNFQFWVKK